MVRRPGVHKDTGENIDTGKYIVVRSHQEATRYHINLSVQQSLLRKKVRFISSLGFLKNKIWPLRKVYIYLFTYTIDLFI